MSRVVVSGALASKPGNGGEAWVRMAWVTGLRSLGFDVWFVEQVDGEPSAGRGKRDGHGSAGTGERGGYPGASRGAGCRAAPGASGTGAVPGNGAGRAGGAAGRRTPGPVEFFRRVTRRFGLVGRRALIDARGRSIVGPGLAELEDVAAETDLLVNVSGNLRIPTLLRRFRRRAYIDVDPGFTQFWHAAGIDGSGLESHDVFFTVGLNVGGTGCEVPTGGIPWHPMPPPVVLEEWPVAEAGSDAFTTVASWRGSYGRVEHGGRSFGLKVHEFRRFIDLPARVDRPLEIALDIHPADGADLSALRGRGWRVVDPRDVVPDPDAYRDYVRASAAEFSVAQGIYVETGSGWFSDRTACYLASGRPALVQDTGFARHLPVGEGLVPFRTLDEAAAGAERITRDYELHRRRARELAAEYLGADLILQRFVDAAGVTT